MAFWELKIKEIEPIQSYGGTEMKRIIVTIAAILLLVFAALTVTAQNKSVTNQDVIRMVNEGLPESVIVKVIAGAIPEFDITPDGVIALSKAKVSENIINAMVEAQNKKIAVPAKDPRIDPSASAASSPAADATETVPGLPRAKGLYYKSSNGFVRIEEVSPATKIKGTGMFKLNPFKGASTAYSFKGKAAPVQVSDPKPKFYYRGDDISPRDFNIVMLEQKKNDREIEYFSAGIFRNSRIGPNENKIVAINATRIGADIIEFTPQEDLPGGEYAIDVGGSPIFDFGFPSATD